MKDQPYYVRPRQKTRLPWWLLAVIAGLVFSSLFLFLLLLKHVVLPALTWLLNLIPFI